MAQNARERDSSVLAELAGELRAEAARQQVNLHELSRRSGIPYPTVQKSLAGRRMIDVVELARLCYALSIAPADLFARIEEWTAADEDDREALMAGAS